MNITQILNMVVSEYGNITQKYMTGILLAGMIFALLNCFMGYRLRKVWGTLLGLAIGAVAGGAAAWYYLGGKQSLYFNCRSIGCAVSWDDSLVLL